MSEEENTHFNEQIFNIYDCDILPKYDNSPYLNAFMIDFSKKFSYQFKEGEHFLPRVVLQFVVTKEGKIEGVHIRNKKTSELTDFEKKKLIQQKNATFGSLVVSMGKTSR
ncbi:MAG: hypothetical protein IJ161_03590 [Bacteroidales bacterium]|nr:hypothetical protein [Bacteroidales bacterium]